MHATLAVALLPLLVAALPTGQGPYGAGAGAGKALNSLDGSSTIPSYSQTLPQGGLGPGDEDLEDDDLADGDLDDYVPDQAAAAPLADDDYDELAGYTDDELNAYLDGDNAEAYRRLARRQLDDMSGDMMEDEYLDDGYGDEMGGSIGGASGAGAGAGMTTGMAAGTGAGAGAGMGSGAATGAGAGMTQGMGTGAGAGAGTGTGMLDEYDEPLGAGTPATGTGAGAQPVAPQTTPATQTPSTTQTTPAQTTPAQTGTPVTGQKQSLGSKIKEYGGKIVKTVGSILGF
ncbi:hypothetical protein MCOR25_007347 [Pyricularia grisea]|nr:hypothetical protein MCOR25_007347 [Pyricularia grisea]